MKKIFKYILLAGLSFSLVSCDKFFDNAEGDLNLVSAEDLLASNSGLLSLLANLYSALPDMSVSTGDQSQMFANGSRSTPSYGTSVSGFWNYGNIRAVNNFLQAVENADLDEPTKQAYTGEGLFIRACYYFASVRIYGGIPIVDISLDDKYVDGDASALYYPRSTEKESWDWVLDQLQQAADLMPAEKKGLRANKYVALAMKARVALWAASESKYWNRAPINSAYTAVQKKLTYMEASYADAYYKMAIDASKQVIESGLYGLAGENPGSISAARDNFIDLFQTYNQTEGVFGRSYNIGSQNSGNGNQGWGPNQLVTGYLQGTYAVTLNLADEYDYYSDADARNSVAGKIATRVDGNEDSYMTYPVDEFTSAKVADFKHYDSPDGPFKLKDARFQAWVAYPGNTFRGKTLNNEAGMVMPDGSVKVYPLDNNGVQFQGATYYPYGGDGENNSFFYHLNVDINDSNRAFYCFQILKGIDKTQNTQTPQTPCYNIRFPEMLLTYAEAVVESNQGDKAKAAEYLNAVRHRAGFKDNVALTLENVLHEWKVEFALENKWTNVLHRRRAFYNPDNTPTVEEGTVGKKLTLVPMVDLSGSKAQWIFLRAVPYNATPNQGYSGTLRVQAEDYYGQIPNYQKNRIEPNNK